MNGEWGVLGGFHINSVHKEKPDVSVAWMTEELGGILKKCN